MNYFIKILPIIFISFGSFASVDTKTVTYDNNKFEGLVVQPDNLKQNTPAILMVHNWMGVSKETQFQAQRFAELGYIVLAADVYGKGQRPKDSKEAGQFAGKYKSDRKLFRENLNVALRFLENLPNVDKNQIAAIGYCFGGTGTIELARSGAPIKAAISFHGGLDSPTPQDGKNIKAQILVHHGATDPFVSTEDLLAFENELKNNKVKYQILKYEGAVHSFTEQGAGDDIKKGAAYNAKADKESFDSTQKFLKKLFNK